MLHHHKFTLAVLVATTSLLLVGCRRDADTPNERLRQGIVAYLTEIRDRSGELAPIEREIKQVLATDARMRDVKGADIIGNDGSISIDIWHIDTRTGEVTITLSNSTKTAFTEFKGTATPKSGKPHRVVLNGITRGCPR